MWSCSRMIFNKLGHKQVLRIYENNRSWCESGHTAISCDTTIFKDRFMMQSGSYDYPDAGPHGLLDVH